MEANDNPHDFHFDSDEYDHPAHDHIHQTTDHGNYHVDDMHVDHGHGSHQGYWDHEDNHDNHDNHHGNDAHGRLHYEHDHTYPAVNHQAPYAPMFSPPQRELPMFQVQHQHHTDGHHNDHHTSGSRRSPKQTFKALTNGQVIDFGNRESASYTQQNLKQFLQQADLDYMTLNGQARSLGISIQNQV